MNLFLFEWRTNIMWFVTYTLGAQIFGSGNFCFRFLRILAFFAKIIKTIQFVKTTAREKNCNRKFGKVNARQKRNLIFFLLKYSGFSSYFNNMKEG